MWSWISVFAGASGSPGLKFETDKITFSWDPRLMLARACAGDCHLLLATYVHH
jgi:hypothetical protein